MTVSREALFKVAKILLIIAIIGTVAFIFINSTLPPEASTVESDTVKEIIVEMLPDDSQAEHFVENYIRKIAHFTEYGLLGIEIAIYLAAFTKRRIRVLLLATLTPLFVGFTDETIQRFSSRGPSIDDVWIDIGGFVFFYSIALAVCFLVAFTARKIKEAYYMKKSRNGEENG